MLKYPNLELIEHIFEEKLRNEYGENLYDCIYRTYEVEVFKQVWPNTATGFSEPGMISGQAFTEEYTTVIIMHWHPSSNPIVNGSEYYGVFFGNELGYILHRPKAEFYEDWRNKKLKSVYEAERDYVDEELNF